MSEQMRKEFEAWFKKAHTGNVQQIDGEYAHGATERLWQAWQASRADIVVELPDWFVFGFGLDDAVYRDDVIEELNKAGVSYK